MKKFLLLCAVSAIVGLGCVPRAHAITVTPTGALLDVGYKEPSTNANGTPLTDLSHCNVHSKAGTAAEVKHSNVAASGLTGGAAKLTSVPVTVPVNTEVNVAVAVSCTDTSDNVSARSDTVNQRIDKLAPGKPE